MAELLGGLQPSEIGGRPFIVVRAEGRASAEPRTTEAEKLKGYRLWLVLKSSPEIAVYAVDGIGNWRDLMATAAQRRTARVRRPQLRYGTCTVL